MSRTSLSLIPRTVNPAVPTRARMLSRTGVRETILLTEQNVNFAMRLAGDIHVLETGQIRLRGTAAELENNAWVRQAYFGG